MMALDGLSRSPLTVRAEQGEVVIEASAASFKELARLCLLLGGENSGGADGFELDGPVHVDAGSPRLRLVLK